MVKKEDLYLNLEFEYTANPGHCKYKIFKFSNNEVHFINVFDNYKYDYTYKDFLELFNTKGYAIIKPKEKIYEIW